MSYSRMQIFPVGIYNGFGHNQIEKFVVNTIPYGEHNFKYQEREKIETDVT